MSKLPALKIKIFWVILALMTASIACNYPDATAAIVESAGESCFAVNHSEYESAAAELGQTAKTPKYPEGAIYDLDFAQIETVSIQ